MAMPIDGSVSTYHGFEYDDQGRILKVTGNYGYESIAEFAYMGWGPIKYILLGGDGSGSKGTKIEYAYHTSGGVQEIRATQLGTGKILFQQFLGYDGKSNGNTKVPGNTARYDGTITQQLYKFADDVNSLRPVRLVNYNFDELGRMLSADFQRNTSGNPLNADGSINFGAFSFENVGDNDSYMTYDLNGRITSQKTGGLASAATYNYQTNSYKLNTVSGQLSPTSTRNMAAGMVYNNRGAMTNDKSKDLLIAYDWNLMPVQFTKNSVSSTTAYQEQYCFYDADGQRVASIEMDVVDGLRTWHQGKHYMTLGGIPYKEWSETYYGNPMTIEATNETDNLLGPSLVGRKNRGVTEYYLYNHQGSVMMTVDENGNAPASGRTTSDYLAFGDRRKLQDNGSMEPITPVFTGKEYEDLYSMYYFGARFYDPELATWQSPDPANQFHSPYQFGTNPINGTDEDGRKFVFEKNQDGTLTPGANRGFYWIEDCLLNCSPYLQDVVSSLEASDKIIYVKDFTPPVGSNVGAQFRSNSQIGLLELTGDAGLDYFAHEITHAGRWLGPNFMPQSMSEEVFAYRKEFEELAYRGVSPSEGQQLIQAKWASGVDNAEFGNWLWKNGYSSHASEGYYNDYDLCNDGAGPGLLKQAAGCQKPGTGVTVSGPAVISPTPTTGTAVPASPGGGGGGKATDNCAVMAAGAISIGGAMAPETAGISLIPAAAISALACPDEISDGVRFIQHNALRPGAHAVMSAERSTGDFIGRTISSL